MIQLNLRAARVNAGYTSKEAAKLIGIHYQTLSKYEHDSSNIPLSLLRKLTALYSVPMDYIFLGKSYDLNRTITKKEEK